MSFDHGSVTFSLFGLNGQLPDDMMELFAAKKAGKLDEVNEEPQFGWVSGHHLLDTDITEENAMRGGCCHLTLRQAVRKIPAALLNALCAREEQAYMRANHLEYVSRKMKKQIKEETLEKHLQKMPPALSGISMVLEPGQKLLCAAATSRTQQELFIEWFYQTVKVEPIPLSPGWLLERDFQITEVNFPILSLDGRNAEEPTTGRDFFVWLWFFSETEGHLEIPGCGNFEVMIEGPLLFADANDACGAGEVAVKKGESPLRSAEAKAALAVGKKLKRAKLTITRDGEIWSGTFDADDFTFRSFKLPEGEELSPDEVFGERIRSLATFRDAFSGFFHCFAETFLGPKAEEEVKKMREWAGQRDAI